MRRLTDKQKDQIYVWFGCACLIYYVICGVFSGFAVSVLWLWLFIGLLSIARGHMYHSGLYQTVVQKHSKFPFFIYGIKIVVIFMTGLFFLIEALIVIHMIPQQKEKEYDYLIVLGARVVGDVPSNALQYRIDTAYDYLEKHPKTIVIVSGGQGAGENISEAECMARILIKRGIAEERIILEEQSGSTRENIKLSRSLIKNPNGEIGIVTNHFHIFRAVSIAKKAGLPNSSGVPAPFWELLLPHYMVREFCSVIVDTLLGNIV